MLNAPQPPAFGSPKNRRYSPSRIACIVFLVVCPATALYVTVLERQRQLSVCGNHLKAIATSSKTSGAGVWPDPIARIASLVEQGQLPHEVMNCPSSGSSTSNYVFIPRSDMTTRDYRTVIAYEPKSNHGDGGNFLYADGHVAFVKGDAYDRLAAEIEP